MSDKNTMVLIYDPTEKNPCCTRNHPNSFNQRIKGTWPDTKYFCTFILVTASLDGKGQKMCGEIPT